MAVTSTPINGTDVILEISEDSGSSYDKIMFLTSANLSTSRDVRDISNKSSAGWKEILEAQKSWSMSADGFTTYSTATDQDNTSDIFGFLNNRTKLYFRFTNANAGDYQFSGAGYITSLEQSSGVEDNLTFSISIEGTGALTGATIS